MQKLITPILSAAIMAAASLALAQADAREAYQKAKTAYASGKFSLAAELAEDASKIDNRNPEVFLLLGKARYQLGQLDKAIAAWKTTLTLAPEEPFAAGMLNSLRKEKVGVDARIKLVEILIREKLFSQALRESTKLLTEKAVSEAQRAKILLLQAEIALKLGQCPEALAKLSQLEILYPKQYDAVQWALLEGQAKLHSGGQSTAEGIKRLRKLVADHAGTPAAATARYELIAWELKQGVNPARVRALAKWLAETPEHPQVNEARMALIEAYLSVTRQGEKPKPETGLTKWDVDALALADVIYKQTPRAKEAEQLTELLLKHLDEHYAKHGAYAAAVKGAEAQQGVPLPRKSRLLILRALVRYKTAIAVRDLDDQARIGKLPPAAGLGALPKPLAEVVALYGAITTESAADPPWADQAKLAATVRGFAAKVQPPVKIVRFKGPDAWAIDIARPVVKADGNEAAVKSAAELIEAILKDYENIDNAEARTLVLGTSHELTGLLSPEHPSWPAVVARHAGRLDAFAKYQFNENVKAGDDAANAKLSDVQKELLAVLAKLVARDVAQAPAAVAQVGNNVQPWIAQGHWAVAEEMYATLAKSLPEKEQRQTELAEINLWLQQVSRRNRRLLDAGLTVSRVLDPLHQKALIRCYELQECLLAESPELQPIRQCWNSVVDIYKILKYYDIAEAAVKVKPEKAVAVADEYAAFQLVQLSDEAARRKFARFLKQYGAAEKITLTPELKTAINGWTKFIEDHPASPMVPQATQKVLAIGGLLQQHNAYDVAVGVYRDFAKFAAGVKVLAQSSPGVPSTAEQAEFTAAGALDAHARKLLAKAAADRQPDDPPPAKLSGESTAAIAAYRQFIADHPESPLVGEALRKVMSIAYEYAKVDAWDVAGGVYADLLKSDLKISRPERLTFARGLCQLGRAMPSHAKEMLQALTSAGLRDSGESSSGEMLAVAAGSSSRGDRPRAGGRAAVPSEEPQPVAPSPAADALQLLPGPADEAQRDTQLLAMIRRQESNRARQVAQLRERVAFNQPEQQNERAQGQQGGQQQAMQQVDQQAPAAPVLSKAEIARQAKAIDAAYAIFQSIRKDYPNKPTAEQARGEILVMVGHWRSLMQWQRAAALAGRFLADNPTDGQLPKLRLEIARDRLAWASKPMEGKATKQQRLDEVAKRFDAARAELTKVVADFPKQRSYQEQAQWDIANSFLKQARVVAAFSSTLARGQFVRAAKEIQHVARTYPKHPNIGSVPQMLWNISQELESRAFNEEAITVWNELTLYDPVGPLAQQAAMKIAQTYQTKLKRPLLAAQAYQELNFARGGNDQDLQNAIFQIGSDLKKDQRWVEALHVLETFVDSFPRHPQAGQALTMVGQIHQTNEAWEDAIAAYRRVMGEFENGQFVQEAKWSIAECRINLSQWKEATDAYREYVKAYPKDAKVKEANRRIDVLKSLVRYQGLVDEKGQRKAFDAQFQIAVIVGAQLSNPVKAIIEYRKVVKNWPESHLADDALYAVGTTYISLGETEKAREALLDVAKKYPASPLADDALYMVGKSYEDEATKLATVTRDTTFAENKDIAQRRAYQMAQDYRYRNVKGRGSRIAQLKKAGKGKQAELEEAATAGNYGQFNDANVMLFAQKAVQEVEELTASQLADRQDKINAALREAVTAYTSASEVPGGDKADEALLQMATIYDQRLKDSQAAMKTWLEIVRQFSGTAVAEDASWRIAQYYEREGKYAEAIEAYKAFLRNYRRSPKAGGAQFAVAENYENLNQWVSAMDSYTNYVTNFPDGPLVSKAKEQINWIKTYRL